MICSKLLWHPSRIIRWKIETISSCLPSQTFAFTGRRAPTRIWFIYSGSVFVYIHPIFNKSSILKDPILINLLQLVEDKPNVKYSDIGGLDSQKQEIREAVELPLTHMNMYKAIGIDPPRNIFWNLIYSHSCTKVVDLRKANLAATLRGTKKGRVYMDTKKSWMPELILKILTSRKVLR